MQRIAIVGAALSLGFLASPSMAQQASAGGLAPVESRYLQSVAPAPPPPRAHYVAPKPPPFPPMPRVQPRKSSTKAVSHPSIKAGRKAKVERHSDSKRHQGTSKHKATSKRHEAASKRQHDAGSTRPAKVHLSAKTIRQCHGMGYKQIMAHRDCRALMQQELAAADQKHKASTRHKASAKTKARTKVKAGAKTKTKRPAMRKRSRR